LVDQDRHAMIAFEFFQDSPDGTIFGDRDHGHHAPHGVDGFIDVGIFDVFDHHGPGSFCEIREKRKIFPGPKVGDHQHDTVMLHKGFFQEFIAI